jgi:xylan 1,4-beta-xylosidase
LFSFSIMPLPLRLGFPVFTAFLIGASALGADAPAPNQRYVNPIPIPNYPVGRVVRDMPAGQPSQLGSLWLAEKSEQYRELADPAALWFEGKWYLYPSVDMAWVSSDEGRTWEHHPLNTRDVGYAPTVVNHQGRFLLMGSEDNGVMSPLYSSKSPLGPFEPIGKIAIKKDPKHSPHIDPMLFSDDNGRLFYYWGCSPRGGIWGVELDAKDPTKPLGEPKELIPFSPDTYPWERVGNNNQNPNTGWMEGSWMVKHNGRYYLTYSAGGTQYRTYAMGAYVSDSPLGPFVPQKRNPIFRTTDGLITGTGHGAIVAGPRGRLWVFYTVFAGVIHGFERRIGLDLVEVDSAGELFVPHATSTPQALPGVTGAEPWVHLNDGEPTFPSSSAPNLAGRLAIDNDLRTWWQPAAGDAQPTLTTHFSSRATIRGVRIVWRDIGLDTLKGIKPGAFRYRIEAETAPNQWKTVIDRSQSTEDMLVDYRECVPTSAIRARLVILGAPAGITPGVAELTIFGTSDR